MLRLGQGQQGNIGSDALACKHYLGRLTSGLDAHRSVRNTEKGFADERASGADRRSVRSAPVEWHSVISNFLPEEESRHFGESGY